MSDKAKSCCPLEAVSNVKSSCKSSQCLYKQVFFGVLITLMMMWMTKKRGTVAAKSGLVTWERRCYWSPPSGQWSSPSSPIVFLIMIEMMIAKEKERLQMGKWWRGVRRSSGLIFLLQDWWGCQWHSGSLCYGDDDDGQLMLIHLGFSILKDLDKDSLCQEL